MSMFVTCHSFPGAGPVIPLGGRYLDAKFGEPYRARVRRWL